jgi:DNA-binding CsgD family transcriptional regulator
MADQARGAVALASGDLSTALPCLRTASEAWRSLRMPYEGARVAVLLGRGYLEFGDRTSAGLELDDAGETFAKLHARVDLEQLASLTGEVPTETEPLSHREVEVLAKVAAGGTNRDIARELSISPHTVRRHLENIFTKLDVSSRAAATAWAYEHDLL